MAPTSPCSPGSEDSTLPLSQPGSVASDRSNGTRPAPLSSNDTGPTFPDGVTLLPTPMTAYTARDAESLREQRRAGNGQRRELLPDLRVVVEEVLTSSSEGSPASPSAPPVAARPRTITAGSGPSSPVSFATLDPDGSWLRTYPDSSVQGSLLGPLLERFYGTWPRSGSMRDGTVYAHPTLERPTSESASSFLHTPTTGDGTPRYDHRASPGYVRNKPVPNLDAQIDALLGDHTNEPSEGGSE